MTFAFEPPLELSGTPLVFVRSLNDARNVLREYVGRRPRTRDLILRRLSAASTVQETGEAARELSLVGRAGRTAGSGEVIRAVQENAELAGDANLKDAIMTTFNYGTQAELFPTRPRKSKARSFGYKRFDSAADAIRFAIEDVPPDLLVGAYLEVEETRFDCQGIRELYESADYPLTRRPVETVQ